MNERRGPGDDGGRGGADGEPRPGGSPGRADGTALPPPLALLADLSPDGVVVLDGDRARSASPRLEAMLGRPPGSVAGEPLAGLVAPHDWPRVRAYLAADATGALEATLRRGDGTTVPVELHQRRVPGEPPTARLVFVRDLGALRQRERELAALADNSPDVIARYDRDHRLRFVNATGERAFGHAREQVLGRSVAELPIPSELREQWARGLRAVLETGQPAEDEFSLPGPDGSGPRHFVARLTPERDGSGAVVGVLVTTRDVTDRRRAEASAEAAGAMFDTLFQQVSVGIAIVDAEEERYTAVNPAYATMCGYAPEELVGRRVAEIMPPEDLDAVRARFARLRAGATPSYSIAQRHVRKDGSTVWVRLSASALHDAAGRTTHFVGIAQDVTEQKLAEEALRRRERVLRDGEHLAGFGSWAWEVGTETVTWSDEIYRIFGLEAPLDAVTQSGFYARIHPDDRAAVVRLVDETVARLGTYDVHYRIVRPDGAVRLLRERAFTEADADGAPVRLVGVTQDVTEREASERALRESEERFRALVEHASDLIAILDIDGVTRYASPSHETVLGRAPESLRGRPIGELVHRDDAAAARALLDRATAGPGPAGPAPLRFRHRDGSWRTLMVMLTDLRGASAIGGIVANSRDVTEQLRLEERLHQSQKLEALGQLAGGVAHDFNNILAAIVGYAQLLVDALAPEDPCRADAEEIARAAARGTEVTGQLLAFSRRQPVERELVDLTAVARSTARMLRPLLPPSITLASPGDDAPAALVLAARAPIAQIVLNLALNARDAMPHGGTLTIDVQVLDAPPEGLPEGAPGGPAARLVVRDTGTGIPPEVHGHLFEPFFTTKPVGRGTGLGLATVYGLTRQFDGTVTVDSEVGRGTTFAVTLPLADRPAAAGSPPPAEPAAAPAAADAPPGPPAARRRILVVEDEAPIRTIAGRALERAGFEAVLEPDGRRALERLRAGEPFDLVLTDAAMPGVSGWRLAAEVAGSRPGLPVVVMSGYAELSDAGGAGQPHSGHAGVVDYLEKPFSTRHLVDVVTRALAGRPAPG